MKQETINEVKELIAQNIDLGGNDLSQFGAEDAIFGDTGLCLDSLDAVDMVVVLEQQFGVTLRQGYDLRTMVTLNDLYDFIEKLARAHHK